MYIKTTYKNSFVTLENILKIFVFYILEINILMPTQLQIISTSNSL